MKKFVAATAVAVMFAVAAPVSAQTGFGAHAGVSLPMGDYGDAAKTGFSGGLDLVVPLMVVPGLGWYSSADAVAHSAENLDGGYLYVPLMTGLRYDIGAGPVGVFLNGQAGFVFHKGPDGGLLTGGDAKWGSDFGFVVGGGARITENVYAGLKYYPLSVDLKYDNGTLENADVDFLDIYVGFGVF